MLVDESKCFVCSLQCTGSTGNVHHLTYERVGKEDVWNDLVTLCKRCHCDIHTRESYDKAALLDMKEEFDHEKDNRERGALQGEFSMMEKLSDLLPK